ncbi:hypothetical protein IF1G_09775 [Cordyceps javanica]|uniref:Uncharacterized protein n=1 Tax=Cordyceps javanica TaxID=43265 RepID=A0A545UQI2_9HYPO|nr:hypothetical protein IF1G_09775 [Cordyceps javanica]TQW03516.1 hypothetical protein IF2G_08814 [Cordyceps javanica]
MSTPAAARQLLRSSLPRLAPRACAGRQQRRLASSKDDLGGPGGQSPIPEKPAGAEAFKRNGPLYAGIGLVAIAAYAYLTQPRETEHAAGKAIAAGERAKAAGKQELQNTKEEIVSGMQQMSGRDADGQKGFRSE